MLILEQTIRHGQTTVITTELVPNKNKRIMKNKLFHAVCLFTLLVTTGLAQSTNEDFPVIFTNWGESVHGAQLAIALTNDAVPVGSSFFIFISMKNLSTNVIYVGESSLGGNYIVSLKNDSGNVFILTRTQLVNTYSMLLPMNPGESRYWVKPVDVNKYYEPPGIFATKTNVPSGDYTLKVTRTFIWDKNAKPASLEANLLKLQIK
jgi:hypothetical protein